MTTTVSHLMRLPHGSSSLLRHFHLLGAFVCHVLAGVLVRGALRLVALAAVDLWERSTAQRGHAVQRNGCFAVFRRRMCMLCGALWPCCASHIQMQKSLVECQWDIGLFPHLAHLVQSLFHSTWSPFRARVDKTTTSRNDHPIVHTYKALVLFT